MPEAQQERPEFAADFRVGDWLVEPSLDRLSRNGTVLRLRPQLIDVLVLLANHAGRTVSKDEILDKVWDGQCVAESGMTRCIAEIRQALEDNAREPKIVQTIPKRGYRLVAPVEFVKRNGMPGDSGVSEPSPADRPSGAAPGPIAALPGGQRRRWTIRSILGLTVLMALAWGGDGGSPAPVLSGQDTIVLADVTNTTGDNAFDQTLRLALAVHLGQVPSLHLVSAEHVRSTLALMGRPAEQPVVGSVALEVCRREGAAVLLGGSIARLGKNYALGLEATACRTGESIDRALVEVDSKDGVLTALGTVAGRVRRALGESGASLRQYDVPVVRATTPSLEALKALSLGDYSREHARLDDALMFYRRATELDPQFAVAWARRGAAARNLGQHEEAAPAFRKAYELRDRVSDPERFYIMGHYYRFVADDPSKAVDTYKMWKRIYPGSFVPPTNLASLYVDVFGRYDEALAEAREAVRLIPTSSIAQSALIGAYLGSNQVPEARQALAEAARHGARDILWHSLAFGMAFAEGDTAGMDEHVRWASGDRSATMQMTQYRALVAAATGRLREARQLWSEAAAAAALAGPPAWQASIKVMEAQTEALLGDPRRARAAAEAALDVDERPATMLFAGIALALSGDHARAARLFDRAAGRTEDGLPLKRVWLSVGRAVVETGSGRLDRSREILREAAPFERGRDFDLAPLAVRASIELSAGRPREATAIFQELLRLRAVAPASPWVAFARLGVARGLRDSGDRQRSLAAYDAVLDSMKGADADAPFLVAARRERDALINPDVSTPERIQEF